MSDFWDYVHSLPHPLPQFICGLVGVAFFAVLFGAIFLIVSFAPWIFFVVQGCFMAYCLSFAVYQATER